MVPLFVTAALEGRAPTINGSGAISRDFTYVDNVVHANMLAASASSPSGVTCNIACGTRYTLVDLMAAIGDAVGRHVAPRYGPPRPGDIVHSQADITLAGESFGYEPVVAFHDGIARTVAWYPNSRRSRPTRRTDPQGPPVDPLLGRAPESRVRRLRIAYVPATLSPGGAERQMLALAERLPRDRFQAEFLVLSGAGVYDARARAAGLRLRIVGDGTVPTGALPIRLQHRASKALRYAAAVRAGRYDIVDAWLYPSDVLAALMRPITRTP